MDLPKSATLADMESMLATIEEARPESPLQLRTASTFDGGILSDIWAAILIGTASRRRQCELIGWGLQEQITSKTVFAMTPAFLTAASVASSISPEVSSRMTGMTKGLERVRRWPHRDGKGLSLILSVIPMNGQIVLRQPLPQP